MSLVSAEDPAGSQLHSASLSWVPRPVFPAGEEPTCGGPSLVAGPAVSCGDGKSPAESAALLVLGQKVGKGVH